MSRKPFFKLYFSDLAGDTLHLTDAEMGSYVLLLGAMWNAGGALDEAPSDLARIARCSQKNWGHRWSRLAKFFVVADGKVIHQRLLTEFKKASKNSLQKAASGSAGGKAKALKSKKADVANATKRASEKASNAIGHIESPIVPSGDEGEKDHGPKARSLREVAEEIFLAQPIFKGARRSSRPDVLERLQTQAKEGADPEDVAKALKAYYALPKSREEGGRWASGAAVMLAKGRWRDFLPSVAQAAASAEPTAEAIEGSRWRPRARYWLSCSDWDPAWGPRPNAPGCLMPDRFYDQFGITRYSAEITPIETAKAS